MLTDWAISFNAVFVTGFTNRGYFFLISFQMPFSDRYEAERRSSGGGSSTRLRPVREPRVLDQASEMTGAKKNVGMVVIRGNSVVILDAKERI